MLETGKFISEFLFMFRKHVFRLKGWDYRWEGYYFITISCQNHDSYFGTVVNGKVVLSRMGLIAKKYWREIFRRYSVVGNDSFVIMPNHMHGIIKLKYRPELVAAQHSVAPQYIAGERKRIPGPQSKSISAIVRSYKAAVSRYAARENIVFQWQKRFHDRIIRDERELYNKRKYIQNNPHRWQQSHPTEL